MDGKKTIKNHGVVFFLRRVLAGLFVGVGGIVPGVSGGILAVSMGIYKPMLDAVANIFRQFKRSFLFLLPIGIGGAIGLFGMSHVIEWALANYKVPVMCLFFGLVAGGVPSLLKEANSRGGFKFKYLIATVCGALFILGVYLLEHKLTPGGGMELNFFTAMLCGGILAIGTVVPGISTSFVLMFLGLYEPLIASVNTITDFGLIVAALGGETQLWATWTPNLLIMLGLVVGLVVVGAVLILFVRKMLERYHSYAYYAILGFLTMSMCIVFPSGLASGLLIVGGFLIALVFDRYMSAREHE
ncbi:MAG: DUF368 domain-containing protein [Clostridia bacterium]|nr:DUF368 domain-containing protein [Clostridia bacterium]